MSTGEFTDAATWGGRPIAHKITDAIPRSRLVVTGTIRAVNVTDRYSTFSTLCLLDDGTGEIGLLFLGRRHVGGIAVGTRCTIEGTARMTDGRLIVWNPLYRIEPGDDETRPKLKMNSQGSRH